MKYVCMYVCMYVNVNYCLQIFYSTLYNSAQAIHDAYIVCVTIYLYHYTGCVYDWTDLVLCVCNQSPDAVSGMYTQQPSGEVVFAVHQLVL